MRGNYYTNGQEVSYLESPKVNILSSLIPLLETATQLIKANGMQCSSYGQAN